MFEALADPTRREVVRRLAEGGPATATELAGDLPVTRQAVAKHLATLAEAGLVTSDRQGRETRFSFTPQPLAEAVTWMADVGSSGTTACRRCPSTWRRANPGPKRRGRGSIPIAERTNDYYLAVALSTLMRPRQVELVASQPTPLSAVSRRRFTASAWL